MKRYFTTWIYASSDLGGKIGGSTVLTFAYEFNMYQAHKIIQADFARGENVIILSFTEVSESQSLGYEAYCNEVNLPKEKAAVLTLVKKDQ